MSYGIRAAWSQSFHKTFYQNAVESLDEHTEYINVIVWPFAIRKSSKCVKAYFDVKAIDPEADELCTLTFED